MKPRANNTHLSWTVRRDFSNTLDEKKRLCKKRIQLTRKKHGVYFITTEDNDPILSKLTWFEQRTHIHNCLKVLSEEEWYIYKDSDDYITAYIYEPLFDTFYRWTQAEASRKANIKEMLNQLQAAEGKNFGQRMHDAKLAKQTVG